MTESPSATERRQQDERLLERVGVETDAGQKLLERFARESLASRSGGDSGRVATNADATEGAE